MISRRQSLKGIAAGAGAALGSSFVPGIARAGSALSGSAGGPKRIIFFLQNQGFDPATCVPQGHDQQRLAGRR